MGCRQLEDALTRTVESLSVDFNGTRLEIMQLFAAQPQRSLR